MSVKSCTFLVVLVAAMLAIVSPVAAAPADSFTNLEKMILDVNDVTVEGDVNNDYVVDNADIDAISAAYGAPLLSAEEKSADLNGDGEVGIGDLVTSGVNYGMVLFGASSGSTDIFLDSDYTRIAPDTEFQMRVNITTGDEILGASVIVAYDNSILNATGVNEGSFMNSDGKTTSTYEEIDRDAGTVRYDIARMTGIGINGSGDYMTITFETLSEGTEDVVISEYEIIDKDLNVITGVDVQNATVMVDINDAAYIDTIPEKSVNESKTITFPVNAVDPEGDNFTMSIQEGPGILDTNYTYISDWDVDHDNEIHSIVLETVDDYNAATDTESFQLTVIDVNRDPSMDVITGKLVDEGQALSFTLSGTDPESDTLLYSVISGPGSIDGSQYSYEPGWDTNHISEVATVTIKADDGYGGTDETSFQLTVNDTNRDPTINAMADTDVDEGGTLSFTVSGSDPDLDALTYSVKSGPGSITGTTYSYSPGWDTDHDNEAVPVTIEANDGNGGTDETTFDVTVIDVNRDPSIDTITGKSVDEGQLLTFTLSGSDPESDTLAYSVTSGPGSVIGTTYSYTAGWDTDHDNEAVPVTIEADDGNGGTDEATFDITVTDVNREPTIEEHSPADMTPDVGEGSTLAFSITASDPESDTLTYSWELDGSEVSTVSTYTYSPGYDDSGPHEVEVTVSDGSLTGNEVWDVTVIDVTVACSQDSDCGTDGYVSSEFCSGLDVMMTYRTYTCNNPGVGSAYCSSSESDILQETCTYICSSGACIENDDPVIDTIANQAVDEGQSLSFVITASDTYDDVVTLSLKSGPGSVTDGVYSYSAPWDGNHIDEVHTVTIEASDGNGGTDEKTFDITVTDFNQGPTMGSIADTEMYEDESLSITLSATDPESDTLTYSITDGLGSIDGDEYVYPITWDSDHENDEFSVTIEVSDGNGAEDDETFTVLVRDVNRPPVIDSREPSGMSTSVDEGSTKTFSVTVTDPDGDSILYEWELDNIPVSTSGSEYSYSPDYTDSGTHTVEVAAYDGYDIVSTDWDVTVNNVGTVSIPLSSGMNIGVEIPAMPVNTEITSVLSSISGKYTEVAVYDPSVYCDESVFCVGLSQSECETVCDARRWLIYNPSKPPFLNTLDSLGTSPFNIDMAQSAMLTVNIV